MLLETTKDQILQAFKNIEISLSTFHKMISQRFLACTQMLTSRTSRMNQTKSLKSFSQFNQEKQQERDKSLQMKLFLISLMSFKMINLKILTKKKQIPKTCLPQIPKDSFTVSLLYFSRKLNDLIDCSIK